MRLNSTLKILENITLLLIISSMLVAAANDPGHDTLYIEQQGDSSLNGTLNITQNLTVSGNISIGKNVSIEGALRLNYLTVYGAGNTTTTTFISADSSNNLFIDAQGDIKIKWNIGGDIVYIGQSSSATSLNISGDLIVLGDNITIAGTMLCLANGSNCPSSLGGANITGTGTAGYITQWQDDSALNNSVIFQNGTNVGIGTTSPGAKLEISQSADNNGIKMNGYDDMSGEYGSIYLTSNGDLHFYSSGNGIHFLSGASTDFAVADGFGQFNAPFYMLDDKQLYFGNSGDSYIKYISANDRTDFFDAGAGTGITISNTGNVGIGMTSPTAKLHVNGSINVTSTNDICIDGGNCLTAINWTTLQNYPTACAAGTAITTIGDTITCSGVNATDATVSDREMNTSASTKYYPYNNTYAWLNATNATVFFVNKSLWTSIDNYPTACAGASAVTTIGDTLTCMTFFNTSTLSVPDTNISSSALWNTVSNREMNTSASTKYYPYNNTYAWLNATNATAFFVNKSLWTSIDNYPSACAAGTAITTIGDTLTCSTVNGTTTEVGTVTNTYMCYGDASSVIQCADSGATFTTATDTITAGNFSCTNCIGALQLADSLELDADLAITGDNVSIDSGTLFVDSTNDRVGIGTTAPNRKLHILGTDGAVASLPTLGARDFLVIENSVNTNMAFVTSVGSSSAIKFWDSGAASNYGQILYDHNGDYMSFAANNAERIRIDTSGNVGIGTTAPDATLDVNGTSTEQLRLTYTDGTAFSNFTTDSGGDLNIRASGGDVIITLG